ncbi:LysR family transcriptional regulator [Vogesella indigofera]|uniref:LysR family transcriptional regulator n=1 Tax=Vogesella indigofera TaxID=45465 RepID=UPI00234E771D|nr:LysR family transcriptional regulator [Vogesella indigofera]MDC7712368.1 LysR family transcriptional regulator [Vogesella indigofera]
MDVLQEMRTLVTITQSGNLSAAARELRVSVAMISKRINAMEVRLGVRLLNRTTRSCSLTEEGEHYLRDCQRILDDVAELESSVTAAAVEPIGTIRVTATTSFGRRVFAPLLANFSANQPKLQIRLSLSDAVQELGSGRHDLALRLGPLIDSTLVATKLVSNRRLVVGSPAYLARAGVPQHPQDLLTHQCIVIQGSSEALLEWAFRGPEGLIHVPVRGRLSTDNGDMQHELALLGAGLALKSAWDVADDLRTGRLVAVLPDYPCPPADLYAVHLSRHFQPRRVTALVAYLKEELAAHEADVLALLPPAVR